MVLKQASEVRMMSVEGSSECVDWEVVAASVDRINLSLASASSCLYLALMCSSAGSSSLPARNLKGWMLQDMKELLAKRNTKAEEVLAKTQSRDPYFLPETGLRHYTRFNSVVNVYDSLRK